MRSKLKKYFLYVILSSVLVIIYSYYLPASHQDNEEANCPTIRNILEEKAKQDKALPIALWQKPLLIFKSIHVISCRAFTRTRLSNPGRAGGKGVYLLLQDKNNRNTIAWTIHRTVHGITIMSPGVLVALPHAPRSLMSQCHRGLYTWRHSKSWHASPYWAPKARLLLCYSLCLRALVIRVPPELPRTNWPLVSVARGLSHKPQTNAHQQWRDPAPVGLLSLDRRTNRKCSNSILFVAF